MFKISFRKVISLVVLFSLVLQSCGPISLSVVKPFLAISGTINYPDVEPSSYQHPEFEHPEPRMGKRPDALPMNGGLASNQDTLSAPTPTSTPISLTPVPPSKTGSSSMGSSSGEGEPVQSAIVGSTNWILNGSADVTTVPGKITLTPDENYLIGSAWAEQQIDLRNSFDMTFKVFVGATNGADGIAFVLQRVGTDALGGMGGGLGYYSLSPSVAVEIDTFRNTDLNDPAPQNSPNNDNHVAILKNGDITHDGSLPLYQNVVSTYENNTEHTLDTGGINYALLPKFKFSEWLIPDVNQPFILR